MEPVSMRRKVIAARTLENVEAAAIACRKVGLPFYVACALLEKESGGRNVYGNDAGGVLSGFDRPVNRSNFLAFEHEVMRRGRTSNGVGPCQITWKGFFTDMKAKGLKPWVVEHNMMYGFALLAKQYESTGSWAGAGKAYNGSEAYGRDLALRIKEWKERLTI